jgi:hypothetical protein
LAAVGAVVVAKLCEPVNTLRAAAMTTIARARNLTVVMLP